MGLTRVLLCMKTVKKIVRILIAVLSGAMILWYAASKIINIGSIIGIAVFGCIGACAVFWEKLSAFLKKIRQQKVWRIVTNTAAVLACGLTVYVAVILCTMAVFAAKTPSDNATLVVLGCQVNGNRPSLMLRKRIEAAYAYLQAHPQAVCVVSGGKGRLEQISEAQCMYNELTAMGIDPDRIYQENQSVNTEQNLAFSCDIIEQNGLSKELAIVTDGFHELRASRIARRQGYVCGAVSADTPFHLTANFTTREILAVTADLFKGL